MKRIMITRPRTRAGWTARAVRGEVEAEVDREAVEGCEHEFRSPSRLDAGEVREEAEAKRIACARSVAGTG